MKEFFNKVKNFCVKNKKQILNITWLILGLIAISVITFLILMAFNVVYFIDGGMQFNLEFFQALKTSWWGSILFIVLQTVLTMLLSVIPGISMAFIILAESIFPNVWHAFAISFASVMISSFVMYFLGRWGGYKLCVKLLGEKDCEQATKLLRNKGTVFFPLMMMFPAFPDDALTMVAGTMKMSLKWFIPSIVLGRGVGIATIVFGISIIPFNSFTAWWHWALFISICLIGIIVIFYFANKLSKYLEARSERLEQEKKSK